MGSVWVTRRIRSCLRAKRRQVLDAGDDGHDPQPRAQRRIGWGLAQRPQRRFAKDSYRGSSRCTATWSFPSKGRFEHELQAIKKKKGVKADLS